jgi:predicted RNase H-like HicB family nuclease
MMYLALIHQDEPEGEFGVSFPDFPGCVTAGNTLAEAKALAGEALFGHLQAMRLAGLADAIPEPSTLGAVMQHEDYSDSLAVLPVEVTA